MTQHLKTKSEANTKIIDDNHFKNSFSLSTTSNRYFQFSKAKAFKHGTCNIPPQLKSTECTLKSCSMSTNQPIFVKSTWRGGGDGVVLGF